MEVTSRGKLPDRTFLRKVQNFARRKKIILIFDECTSDLEEILVAYIFYLNSNPI